MPRKFFYSEETSTPSADSFTNASTYQSRRTGRANRTDSASRAARFFRLLAPAVIAALVTLALCHVVTHPPAFLQSEEERFVAFTEEVFRSELSGNTLNLHYLVADPASYGLEDAEVSLGRASTEAREASYAALENDLDALLKFDYEKLSARRQLTYDIFLDYLETELGAAELLLYDEPLGPTLGVQAQLPILLAEYAFRTKGDIEDYLALLAQVPDYFDSILEFEQDKSEAGLFMSSDCALDVIEQCLDFAADEEDHYLLEIFDEKIDAVTNLTADEKIAYKEQNKTILTGYVLPAYRALAAGLAELEDTGTNEMGLYYYPDGQEYYEYLVKSQVGDSRSIEEIEEQIKTQMVEDYAAMQDLMERSAGADTDGPADYSSAGNDTADTDTASDSTANSSAKDDSTTDGATDNMRISDLDDASSMLEDLRAKITDDFPLLPSVSYEIKYVHESLQDYLSPAFYLSPAIDDYTTNVIYINPASGYSGLDLYTTLAHEGYPGHLYQNVYFASQSPDLIRHLLDVGGYTEGWATYVEMYAYSLYAGYESRTDSGTNQDDTGNSGTNTSDTFGTYTGSADTSGTGSGNADTSGTGYESISTDSMSDSALTASISQLNRSFTLGLASLLDIGIHYRGYTPEEVSAFLTQLGFSESTAESLYTAILEAPANYLQYYVGYLNFVSLRDTLSETVSGFTLKAFHQAVLETGPAPFTILEEQCIARLTE
ncbi:MAG: DUF885 domain-containing protein [Lachnospiraceae bacterium]|nr:DUF885 domain-containing protein [Lachnospiraceae bacterium]